LRLNVIVPLVEQFALGKTQAHDTVCIQAVKLLIDVLGKNIAKRVEEFASILLGQPA
jgi:hypothetical protein